MADTTVMKLLKIKTFSKTWTKNGENNKKACKQYGTVIRRWHCGINYQRALKINYSVF